MYGLVLNNITKYFYVRDILQNILGLVDESGTLVVKYSYNAFGEVTIVSDTSGVSIGSINPFRYKGYYYDVETQLFYCNSRYYSPELCRFISPDSIEYLDPESINGLNLYAYCMNDPINYADPSGHFVITTAMIWGAICVGAAIGAGIGLGATVVKDLENGKLFDGDVTFLSYVGNFLGGGIAGAGIGLCSVLGAGLGAALASKTSLIVGAKIVGGVAVGGAQVSGLTALGIGVGSAFATGGLGYVVRTGFSDQEEFEWSDMFIEAGANAISGMLTFTGAMVGGILGVKVPGAKFSFKNFALYNLGATYFGVYPAKIILAYIKKKLKERY